MISGSFGSMASLALQGLHAAELDALQSARAIAEGDLDNLAEHLSNLSLARVRMAANMKVLQVVDQTEKDVLDMFA